MYHRFSANHNPLKVECKIFEEHVKYLKKYFRIITTKELCERVSKGKWVPHNSVIITIDDGYADCYEFAYPILRKYDARATIFLATDFVDNRRWLWTDKVQYILNKTASRRFGMTLGDTRRDFNLSSFDGWRHAVVSVCSYCRSLTDGLKDEFISELSRELIVSVPETVVEEFAPLTWDQIMAMKETCIEFGSHTVTHPILSKVDEKTTLREIRKSKETIENKLSEEIHSFCYPNGTKEDFTEKTVSILQNVGYRCAVTSIWGMNRQKENLFHLRRIGVGNNSNYEKSISIG
jgi:peptidoglycan/xylan/chitin deacetylase (PgdA/CDA1 family)